MDISRYKFIVISIFLVAAAFITGYFGGRMTAQMPPQTAPVVAPPVKGFYGEREIFFIHTETSDQQVASMLSGIKGSPVILVPGLKQIPDSLLGDAYVFAKGVNGGGPFGFQPDVFSSVPGNKDYTPLRAVNLVNWKEGVNPQELKSVEDIKAAEAKSELTVSRPSIIESMEEKVETVIAVGYDGKLTGLIGLADTVKEDAAETVEKLRELEIEPLMITGDNERTAKADMYSVLKS